MRSDSEMVNLRSVIETLCYMVDEDSDGVEEVMQLPSIDLVRCGECRYYLYMQKNSPYKQSKQYCNRGAIKATNPDDFCSYGERRASK